MNCNELRDHYELYAIGVAEDPERAEIRAHLNRQCEVCMKGMKQAREVAALLGGTAAAGEPSAKLRRRILASVGVEERRFGWAPFLAAALAMSMVAVVFFAGQVGDVRTELARTRDQMRQQSIDLTRMTEAFAIMHSPDTTVSTFGAGARGSVFASKSSGVVLIASNLPPAPVGKKYEMWTISPRGPKAAGMFQSAADGSAMHVMREPVDADATLVAVTLEPEAGSTAPTTTPLFAAPIRALVP
jgi:hypothetical protein